MSGGTSDITPQKSLFGRNEFTSDEKARISKLLQEKLNAENLRTRPGQFGGITRRSN